MKKNRKPIILLVVIGWIFGFSQYADAQRALSGRVSDPNGEPLVGATVGVQGFSASAVTDAGGNFSLTVPNEAATMIVRYVGYGTLEVPIGSESRFDIVLQQGAGIEINAAVVTALGISREKKSLGYAVQDLKGEDLAKTKDPNLLSDLQGKLAGVQVISAASQVGSSARVVIRGNSSIFGNNQPLFVVNGVPTDNSSFSAESIYGGVDFGNAISDISADDIESISVLKGPAAAALYGSRAGNGVILITTKSGKSPGSGAKGGKGLGVTYSGSFGLTGASRFWQYQDEFGQGNGQQFRYVDGTGTAAGNLYDGVDESWGPAFDVSINEHDGIDNNGDGTVDEANEGAFIDQHTGKNQPWQAHPNSLLKSFDTGLDFTNHLSITSAGERVHARFSYTNFYQQGMVPNTDLKRNSFNLAFGADLSKKISTEGNILYVRTDSKNRPAISYNGNILVQALWSGRQVDWEDLREKWNTRDEFGRYYNWNHNYYSNPFWSLYENLKPVNRDRINGYYSVTYALTDWLKIKGRIGDDFYRENRKQLFEKEYTGFPGYPEGRFQDDDYYVNERNADLLLTAQRHFGERFSLFATLGANRLNRKFRQSSVLVEALVLPNIFNVSNARGNPAITEFNAQKTINSVYGTLSTGYLGWMFLDLSARNDWSSTLPAGENSYFYPSVNLGVVLSDALNLGKRINFLKIRAGWARVGSDTDPYQIRPVYVANPLWKGIPSFTVSDVLPNAALKPEIKTSFEIGLELLTFGKRLGLDLAWYNSEASDQILPVDASPTTGFGTRVINAGTVQNRGVEVQLHGIPVRKRHFSWNIAVNWAKNKSKVLDLPEGVDAILIGDNGGCRLEAREGEDYGVLYGTRSLRNAEGKLVLVDGLPQTDPIGSTKLGSISPDWIGGIRNTLTYKRFSLDFLIDARFGNEFLSWGYLLGTYTGAFEETLEGRRTAEEIKNGYAFDGVIDNGDGTYRPNDVKVSAEAWNKASVYGTSDFGRAVLDGSFVKLREVNLAYELPERWAEKLRTQRLSVALYARNLLFLYTGQPHYDPEYEYTTNNADQGWEVCQFPATRTVGVQFNAGF